MDPFLALSLARDRRVRALITGGAVALAIAAAIGSLLIYGVLSTFLSAGNQAISSQLTSACVAPAATQAAYAAWSAEQTTNAATIIRVGQADNVPEQGWIDAVATAMQESGLVNLNYGDRDSLGLFQQRPSQGWGTAAQVMDPVYAANQFYTHLLRVPGWQSMPLTQAAQAVQASGTPDAYAKWQTLATQLVTRLTGGGTAALAAASQTASCGTGQVPQGTPAQLQAALSYAYGALGSMYDYGGSCTAPKSPDMQDHCDCSSLVMMSFRQIGIDMPRTAEAQWEWGEAGHAIDVPISQAQVGDVVYFPSYLGANTMGHTGIVTDPATDTMINAPETGKPVGFASYNPAGLPYGTHMFHILRFVNTGSAA